MVRMSDVKRRKMEADKSQTMLDFSHQSGAKVRGEEPTTSVYPITTKFMCPFCLYIDNIYKFRVKTKEGYSEKRARCPDCDNLMQIRSLTKPMSIEEYAEWVFNYSLSGFWEKCPYKKFRERMWKLGWSRRFWKKYKELKGEGTTTTYEEYAMAQQEE